MMVVGISFGSRFGALAAGLSLAIAGFAAAQGPWSSGISQGWSEVIAHGEDGARLNFSCASDAASLTAKYSIYLDLAQDEALPDSLDVSFGGAEIRFARTASNTYLFSATDAKGRAIYQSLARRLSATRHPIRVSWPGGETSFGSEGSAAAFAAQARVCLG